MLSVDPMYHLYPSVSPYAYTLNNPVRYTDPTGMTPEKAGSPDPPSNDKNIYPYTAGTQQLGEVTITTSNNGANLTNSSYTKEDYRVRSQVLNAGGPTARALRSAEAAGKFKPLYNSSGHWSGFSEEFNAGATHWKEGDIGYTLMMATFYSVGTPLLAGVGGSYFSLNAPMPIIKMGVDISLQYGITGDVDLISAVASGVGLKYGLGAKFVGANLDYSLNKQEFNSTLQYKPLNHMMIDFGASLLPGLSKRMSSPGNYLGPNGVDFTGNAFGIFGSKLLKK